MNNFNSSTAKGNASGLLSDDEAMSVYRAIPTEQDADKKQALVGLLGSYTEAKRAAGLQPFQQSPEAKQAQAERFEGLYASMDAVDSTLAPEQQSKMQALLATSADPKEAKARMVNMAYIQQLHGKNLPPEWNGAMWPAIRAQYVNQAFGMDKPEITDVELYGAIGGRVKQDKENRAALTALVGKMHEAAFNGDSDWMKAYEQSKAPVDPAKSMDAAWADKMRLVAKNSFNQVKEKADRLRPMANDIVGSLARIKGTREGFEDVRGFSMDELIQKIDSVPDADRPLLYSVIAQQVGVSPEIKDEKGVVQQSGESIGRGFVEVAKANKRAISDNPALINARALVAAGDNVAVAGERKPGESMVDWVSRSMQGNYGIVDFAKDVITQSGQPFLRNRRAMTADELDAFKSEVTTMERKRTISDELDELANAVVDPVKGSNFFTKRVLYPALESAAYSAQAFVPYAGIPLLIGSTLGMRSQEMMDRGMSIEDAQKGALVSALIEAPVEAMQAKMVAGSFPIFKKLLEVPVEGFVGLAKRGAAVMGVQVVEQNIQEAVQDATPLLVQHVASKLSDSVPGLDWNKELAEYGKGRVDTFWALLPMVMVGTGSATFSDAAFGRQYFNDVRALKAVGFTEEAVTKIMEAPTLEEKQAIMKSMWSDEQMRVMNGVAQQAAFADMDAEMQASYLESSSAEGAQIRRLEDGRFEVTTPDGELLDETSSVDAALQLARDWNEADQLNMTTAIEDMIGYVESFQEAGQSIELMDTSKTFQDRVNAGEFTQEEADGIVELYVGMGRLKEGSTPGTVTILGENEVTKYDARRRIVSDVSRIYDGASPLTVVEEHAEGYLKRRLADGSVTLEDIMRWRKSTGDTSTNNSERVLTEWFSEQSQAYLVGKSQGEALPSSFRAFLSKLRQYLGKILDLSVRLMELDKAGKLEGGFKKHLARSVGLDEAYIDAQHRADERGQMDGRGPELMGWLKGKLPHPETAKANGEQLAGELQTVWEGFKSPQAARAFFAPKGVYTPLDQIAGMARDDGFAFETADDLLKGIDSSLRGEEVFAESGTGATFSLSDSRAKPADASNVTVLPDGAQLVGPTTFSITSADNILPQLPAPGLKPGMSREEVKASLDDKRVKRAQWIEDLKAWVNKFPESKALVFGRNREGDYNVVTKNTTSEDKWRVTYFSTENGEMVPTGHSVYGDRVEAVKYASDTARKPLLDVSFSLQDYRGIHKAPVAEEGASIDNPSNIYPDDIYSAQAARYYGHFGDARDNEAIRIIQGLKGRPNAKVVIYRAVPKFGAENKAKLKELNQLLGYRAQPPFFPLGNKVVAGLEEKYAGEANYDKRQALVKEDLERQVAELETAVKGDKVVINPGDWVTTTRAYAVDHGESALNGSYDVLKKTVAAKELFTNGDSIHEWGYSPEGSNTTFSITAFHGTPHKVDKFSTSKIGTGEGAQAYGWGIYFAESKAVAEEYRRKLAAGSLLTQDGQIFDDQKELKNINVRAVLNRNNGDIDAAIVRAKQVIESIPETQGAEYAASDIERLNRLKEQGGLRKSTGNLYTVELLPDADSFLDWDKPLSEQSDKVKAALAKLDPDTYSPEGSDYDANETGQMVHARLWENLIRSGKAAPATEKLRDAAMKLNKLGVVGIRYLDGASRGNQFNIRGAGSYYTVINTFNGQKVAEFTGEGASDKAKAKSDELNGGGTRNYVIFDESLVKIIEENGKKVDQAGAATFSLQTETPEFKRWFGDSKVVDADGKPLVVYHGTAAEFYKWDENGRRVPTGFPFTAFSKDKLGIRTDEGYLGRGFYFTDEPRTASWYAGMTSGEGEEAISAQKEGAAWALNKTKGRALGRFFVSLQNPLIVDQSPDSSGAFDKRRDLQVALGLDRDAMADVNYVSFKINDAGYDGVIYRFERGGVEVVALEPGQIKSATGNRGTFDPGSPDITMAMESSDRVNEIKNVMRKHTVAARVAAADHQGEAFSPELRKAMEDRLYRVIPNRETIEEALKVVAEKGVGGAMELVLSRTTTLTPNVQVALGMALMEHFNAKKQFEKAIEVGERVSELGTELGRGVQAFSLLGKVLDTPEKAQIFVAKKLKSLEAALRERKPVIDASKDVLGNVQEEALKLLEKWLDEINGVSSKPMASRKAVRTEDLPEITFSLSPDVRKSGIVSVVARMLKESGAVETRKALVEKYGDKVVPHVADILIEAQKQLMAKAAVKQKKPTVAKSGASAEDKGKDRSGPRMNEEEIDNALAEIHATGRKAGFQDQMQAIEEHFTGKRMTDAQIEDTLALGRALGLGGKTTTLEGFDDLVKRFEDEVINRLKVKGFETPESVRDAVRKLFETKGVKFTREDIARVFAEKFNVPKATEAQNKRLAVLAENIRSTPEFSTARTDATVEMMNHINDVLKPADALDKAWAVWYANVLSGYNTHFRNLYGNSLEQMISLPLEAMRANPVKTLQLMREMLYGVKAGVSIGLAEAKNQLKTGEASVLQTESNKFGTAGTLERVSFAGGQANPFNWLKIVGRALRAEDLFAYATAQEAKARMVAWEMADANGLIGEERQAEVERLLNATEQQIGDFAERASREWDDLTDELKAKGNREEWEARRVAELRLLERNAALIERASEFAARATFNYKPDGFVGIMANGLTDVLGRLGQVDTSGNAELVQKALMTAPKLVVPFVRIVANVLNRGIDYTGGGVARSMFPSKRVGSLGSGKTEFVAKSADERAMELKRGIFGIVVLGVLSGLADPEDEEAVIQIHGSGAGSREKNQALNGPKWMPYSIEFRGSKGSTFYTFKYSPLLMGLALVGNYHDARRYRKLDEKDLTERLAVAAAGVGSVLLDQSFLSNAADLLNIFGRDGQVSENALYSFMGRTFNPATVALPFSSFLRQMERDFDPVQRSKPDIMASLFSNVPVASRFNAPALDVLGDAIESRPFDWMARAAVDGTPEARIYRAFGAKDVVPTSIWSYKGKMEPEQFYNFTKERGALLKESLMRNDAAFLKLIESSNEEVAAKILENLSRSATQMARVRVGYFPEVKTKIK